MVLAEGEKIASTTTAIAAIDVAASNALLAVERGYVRPTLVTSPTLNIVNGRHPIVEAVQVKLLKKKKKIERGKEIEKKVNEKIT